MTPTKIRRFNLQGDWFDMGGQLGRFVAGDIKSFNDRYFSDPFNLMRFGSWISLQKYVARMLETLKEYSLWTHDFLRGMAEGSALPLEQVVMQAMLPELTHIGAARDWPLAGGCTAGCIVADRSATGAALVGQCWDFNFELPPWFLAALTPSLDIPPMLIVGMGSFFCCGGINDRGLGLTVTSSGHLPNVPPGIGVPVVALLLEALGCSGYYEAMDILVAPKKAGAFNMLLTDGYARSALIEGAVDRVELIEEKPILVCGNHFQHPNMVAGTRQNLNPPEPAAREFARSSVARADRLQSLLETPPGEKISLDYLKTCLKDHENYPLSICAHEEGTILHFRTLGAMILEPASQTLHFSPGQPCQNELETVKL
jgi:isopenicillin-N N-acyltransferase like protein